MFRRPGIPVSGVYTGMPYAVSRAPRVSNIPVPRLFAGSWYTVGANLEFSRYFRRILLVRIRDVRRRKGLQFRPPRVGIRDSLWCALALGPCCILDLGMHGAAGSAVGPCPGAPQRPSLLHGPPDAHKGVGRPGLSFSLGLRARHHRLWASKRT